MMKLKSLPFVPTFLTLGLALLFAITVGPVVYDSAFCKAKAYEILSGQLKRDFPDKVQSDDLDQGRHVAVVYNYGSTGDVVEWYFQTKWKYSGQ